MVLDLEKANYDRTDVVKKEIIPLIKNLKEICLREQIPMFVSFASRDTGAETDYLNEMLSPVSLGIQLSNDKISPMLKVVNDNFDVVPKSLHEPLEIEF